MLVSRLVHDVLRARLPAMGADSDGSGHHSSAEALCSESLESEGVLGGARMGFRIDLLRVKGDWGEVSNTHAFTS